MFKKGRIGIFGDSLTRIGDNINDLSKPMVWSQMLKFKYPEYEFIVDGVDGRRMWNDGVMMEGKKRDGSQQLEPFLSSSFPCKKIIIFLGTNDIFGGVDELDDGLNNLHDFEIQLVKFRNLLFQELNNLYEHAMPAVYFITTHHFNFEDNGKHYNVKPINFQDYNKISNVFQKLENVNIIDVSKFEVNNPDGVHLSGKDQIKFFRIIEKRIFKNNA